MKKKFPYALDSLHWDSEHNKNTENKYCYCGKDYKNEKPVIRCEECKQWFHGDCINCLSKPLLFGDTFGEFHCSVCTKSAEKYERKSLSWVTIVHWVIYNLIRKAQIEDAKKPKKEQREHYYFRWKEDVCAFIDDYWDYLAPEKQRSLTWNNTIASVLSTHSDVFLSGYEKFHQTAWWTLYKIEPPSKEKRAKPNMKQKPKLKKPLKRSRAEENTSERPKRNLKRQKEDDIVEIKQEPQDDLMDLSSLSELSSAEEISDSDNDDESNPKSKSNHTGKSSPKAKQSKSSKATKKDTTLDVLKSKAKSSEKEHADTSKSKEKEVEVNLENTTKEQASQEEDQPISTTKDETNKIADQVDTSQENIPPSPETTIINTPNVQTNQVALSSESSTTDTTLIIKEETIQDAPRLDLESTKPNFNHTQKSNTTIGPNLTQQNEWHLLQKLEHASKKLPFAANRYKRKLAMRRLKRNLGIKLFDLDHQVVHLLKTAKTSLEPISKSTTIAPASNQIIHLDQPPQDHFDSLNAALLEKITYTPYSSSFASRLYGSIRHRSTITRDEPWLSSWNGRKLRPFIRRDFESRPPRMKLLNQIRACHGKPCKKGGDDPAAGDSNEDSIDYVYFQKEHLVQVNQMLCRSFWEGIDVSESLLYPEFSVVALYKRKVIACAFMTPEAYITYIAVEIGWENANIGQFMLYHLFQTAISKDVTLHVSANNNAMILYQKFGFKPEEFVVNFYDKYLPADSSYSKNAFFMRLRR